MPPAKQHETPACAPRSTADLYALWQRGGGKVTTDSRAVAPGDLFVALRGDRFDGNQFAAQALAQGAVAAVVNADADLPRREGFIAVDDPLSTLQELATFHRRRLGIPLVALTGSNGKTTTKELIAAVLRTRYRVACTQGNLNNHIGVPLTLLSMGTHDQLGVVEMGANHAGEIADLCRIAQPDAGLITNIGRAHLEGFGGPEGVARAKGELFDYLEQTGGTALYNADIEALAQLAARHPKLQVELYRRGDFPIEALPDPDDPAGCFVLRCGGRDHPTHLSGDHNLQNVLAALAVGRHFGIDPRAAVEAIAAYRPDNNRSQVVQTERNTLYLDAYNANPSSMACSLDHFLSLPAHPKALILGDMRELGSYSAAEHRRLVERLAGQPGLCYYLAGTEFAAAAEGTPCQGRAFAELPTLMDRLRQEPLSGYHILLKGSRGMALEQLIPLL